MKHQRHYHKITSVKNATKFQKKSPISKNQYNFYKSIISYPKKKFKKALLFLVTIKKKKKKIWNLIKDVKYLYNKKYKILIKMLLKKTETNGKPLSSRV